MKTTKKKTKTIHYVDVPFVIGGWEPEIKYETKCDYKCPDCNGEFNTPSIDYDGNKICPFCGRKMY